MFGVSERNAAANARILPPSLPALRPSRVGKRSKRPYFYEAIFDADFSIVSFILHDRARQFDPPALCDTWRNSLLKVRIHTEEKRT